MKIIKKIYIPILFFLIGILIVFYPVIFINNELMPGDLGDGRFINYVLEHFYLFLSGSKLHNSFWNLPFFYPYTNTLSYSDIMFGGMILYAPIRFFVDSPQTALQIWLFFACLFNFNRCTICNNLCCVFYSFFDNQIQSNLSFAIIYAVLYAVFFCGVFCFKKNKFKIEKQSSLFIGNFNVCYATIYFVLFWLVYVLCIDSFFFFDDIF